MEVQITLLYWRARMYCGSALSIVGKSDGSISGLTPGAVPGAFSLSPTVISPTSPGVQRSSIRFLPSSVKLSANQSLMELIGPLLYGGA